MVQKVEKGPKIAIELESHIKFGMTESDLLVKFNCPKIGKMGRKMANAMIFKFVGKFGHYFLLTFFYNGR